MTSRLMRIGEVASQTGLTARTIRWWERLGLVEPSRSSARGTHRLYDADDVERLRRVDHVRDVLGLPLEELARLLDDEATETVLARRWDSASSMQSRIDLVDAALASLDRQLGVVAERKRMLTELERELLERQRAVQSTPLAG